jgi:hypothetical protein
MEVLRDGGGREEFLVKVSFVVWGGLFGGMVMDWILDGVWWRVDVNVVVSMNTFGRACPITVKHTRLGQLDVKEWG